MSRPQRPAEFGPRRFTRLFVFILAVLGSAVGVANLPSGANAQPQPQVDSGYLGFETDHQADVSRTRTAIADPIAEPEPVADLHRSADASRPRASRRRSRPSCRRPRPSRRRTSLRAST